MAALLVAMGALAVALWLPPQREAGVAVGRQRSTASERREERLEAVEQRLAVPRTSEISEPEGDLETADPSAVEPVTDRDGPAEDLIELRGEVVEAFHGRPIEGAEVFLNGAILHGYEAPRTTTGPDGCFSLGSFRWESVVTITITADGYRLGMWGADRSAVNVFHPNGDHPHPMQSDPCGLRFELRRGARVFGKVVDQFGVAVTEGYVIALDPGAAHWRWLELSDPMSFAGFFNDGTLARGPTMFWEFMSAPFSPIDDEGAFDITCLPAEREMFFFVVATDVTRANVGSIKLDEGEEAERTLEVERVTTLQGRLLPPEGAAPDRFSLWGCRRHAGRCERQHDSVDNADLWIPVMPDGSFVAGPLVPGTPVQFWVSHRTPVPPNHIELFSTDTIVLDPGDAASHFLEVDLRRPQHFTLLDAPR